jgi:hypothetical protein
MGGGVEVKKFRDAIEKAAEEKKLKRLQKKETRPSLGPTVDSS